MGRPFYETANELGGMEFRTAIRSLKRYKRTQDYRNQLRECITRAGTAEAEATTQESKRKARLRGLEARAELDLLLTGESPDVFRGAVHLPMPTED